MERSEELRKFVYEDGKNIKVIKGYILEEDEFTYKVEALGTNAIITIGKRVIVKVSNCRGGKYG